MTNEEAKNFGFIARMNHRSRVPVHDKKFFDRVCKEKPDSSPENSSWAPLLDSWLKGWDEADKEYKQNEKK